MAATTVLSAATELVVDDEPFIAALSDANTPGYYKFEGKAGDRVVINASARRVRTRTATTPRSSIR